MSILSLAVRIFYGAHIRDDAYITLRYAAHLAGGLGFAYNPGQRVIGTTTPLFTLLLALLARIGVQPAVGAIVIGIACDTASVIVLWALSRRLVDTWSALFSCLFFALFPPLVAYAVSGMETPLYLLLILGGFWLALDGRPVLTATVCALLVLLRPDGILVPIALVGGVAWSEYSQHSGPLRWAECRRSLAKLGRWLARPVGVFLLMTLPWFSFAWWYAGTLLPQSMLAKWVLPGVPPFASFSLFAAYFLSPGPRWLLPISLLAGAGIFLNPRFRLEARALLLWGALYSIAFLASNKFVYPLWPFQWYFLPLLIPLALAAGEGLCHLLNLLRAPSLVRLLLLVGFVVIGVQHLVEQRSSLDRKVAGREALYVRFAAVLAREGAAESTVAAAEIGALGYAHPGPILDLAGLVSPQTVGESLVAILKQYHPPWLVLWDTYDKRETDASGWFRAHYRPVRRLSNWESRELILYRWYPDPQPERLRGASLGGSFDLVGRRMWWQMASDRAILHIELTWHILRTPAHQASFSVQVLGVNGQKLAQQDNPPQEGSSPVTSLRAGELITDRYDLSLSRRQLSRIGSLLIEGYQSGNPADGLSWTDPAGRALGQRLFAPLPQPPHIEHPSVTRCEVPFDGGLELVGYSVQPTPGVLTLLLRWRDQLPLAHDYTVFVHVFNDTGKLVGQADAPPVGGSMPTSTLLPGDEVDDRHVIVLQSGTSADHIRVGLYLPQTGRRLQRAGGHGSYVTLPVQPAKSCE